MRVVVVIEDSLPVGRVGPEHTPFLWSLIADGGGWSPGGGRSVLASSTYPNHATFVTGVDVADHRIFTNKVWNGERFVCSSTVGPAVETIFDAARRAGVSTSAVLGDQTMTGSMGANGADVNWPPMSGLPDGTATDSLGYAANSAVIDQIDALRAFDADLCLVHMNEPDSALHLYGPHAAETIEQIHRCDRDLAAVVERLRSGWDDTVLFVLSDHEQEAIDQDLEALDLSQMLHETGLPGHALNEGTVGLIVDGATAEDALRLPDITGAKDLDEGFTLVWSDPGRVFGTGNKNLAGQHGSPRTTAQVATVAGGHPQVVQLAAALASTTPYATQWAPTIAGLLGFTLPAATGAALCV